MKSNREHPHTISMQIEYAQRGRFDERRHKAHCIWLRSDDVCGWSFMPCTGSSHCKQYRDKRDERRTTRFVSEYEAKLQGVQDKKDPVTPISSRFSQKVPTLKEQRMAQRREVWRSEKERQRKEACAKEKAPAPPPLKKIKTSIPEPFIETLSIKKNVQKQEPPCSSKPITVTKSAIPFEHLLGKQVNHKTYGKGFVSEVLSDGIKIKFISGEVIEILHSEMFGGTLSFKF